MVVRSACHVSLRAGLRVKLSSMKPRVEIKYVAADFAISNLDNENWSDAMPVPIISYWSGERAPAHRHADARLLWSDSCLYVRFEAPQAEPLIISETPDLSQKTLGLWDRDVCEIFVAPDAADSNRY